VPAKNAAEDMLRRIRYAAQPVLDSGRDAVVSIILDGENAWEFYPQSGREFLRRLYDGIAKDPLWLGAQVPFVELSDKMREDPLVAH
jgi:alpha-amylase/alpha-mannosidase (GH57 family)